MKHTSLKQSHRKSRHARIRSEISGTAKRPRVAVYKSNRSMYVQVIDDGANKTLVGMSNLKLKSSASAENFKGNKEKAAFTLGQLLGTKMKEMGVGEAVFDRGGFQYHGRVKAVADGIRQAGIKM